MAISSNDIVDFVDTVSAVPQKTAAPIGAAIGGGVGVVESQSELFGIVTSQEMMKVVFLSLVGAVVTALANWGIKSLARAWKRKRNIEKSQ